MTNSTLLILVAAMTLILIRKIYIRLQLSRAKHPSLRGHAKWSRRIARQIPFFSYNEKRFFNSDGAPQTVREKRKQALNSLSEKIKNTSPNTLYFSQSL